MPVSPPGGEVTIRRRSWPVGRLSSFFYSERFKALRSWAAVEVPVVFSPFYLGIVADELSHDVLRASELVGGLQVSEAVLRKNQVTLQASNKQISQLLGRLIGAQETERRRIARDLHDDLS
jgi:signal transduction histidine kinase